MSAVTGIPTSLPLLGHHSSLRTFRICPSTFLPTKRRVRVWLTVAVAASQRDNRELSQKSTKLITFLGKGGSGKTTAAVFAAQHYAILGLRTCLVIHSQDPMADHLLNCKIGNSPVVCQSNLSAVRLETTEMLLEPLKRLKQADAHLNLTQGVLDGIVGEELGVLPGMDSILMALALEKLARLLSRRAQWSQEQEPYDVVIYDGISTEETLRMIGAPSKARLYLKYMRNLAEKTDLGRLAGPSLMRLVDEAMTASGNSSSFNGRMSPEIWDAIEQLLERGSLALSDPSKVGCFLVMDPNDPISIDTALRYWGCTIQAGAQVSGAFGAASHLDAKLVERVKRSFSPLHTTILPHISTGSEVDWSTLMRNNTSDDARHVLSVPPSKTKNMRESVIFDSKSKTVTLFMPGFDKSEIKLYQYRGGSELLVEAGDQRRVILLPSNIQGRVRGAKFIDRSLVIGIQ